MIPHDYNVGISCCRRSIAQIIMNAVFLLLPQAFDVAWMLIDL